MAEVENTGNSFNIQNDNGDVVNMFPTTTGASSQNLYNEQVSVGNGITGPKPQTSNNRQAAEQLLNNILVNNNNTTDRYAYAKPTTFNSTHTGLNFDRYYNHPNFRKLGFSPYRDNETIYNKNSSWSDDFRRASTQYGTLWGNGFSSLFKNWGSLASSTPDFEGAHTMEKAMAIGSSSKDGFGASFTNFYLNSAYTVGVLSEIAVEEIGLALATAATGGMATPVAVGRTALNVGRFSKAIGNLFKGAKNVSTARKVWNVAKKITPFGDTADLARGIIAGDRATLRGIYQTQNALDAFAKSKALFGQFYRDVREINAASAESKLEAGMVSNQVSADLINKFYAENGKMPNDAESKMIYDRAQRAGAETFLYNMPAIYFSNKIVLETAFKGIKPLRNIIGEVPGRLRPVIQAGKDGKKIAKILDLDATKTYFTKDYWKNIGKGMSPKKILGAGLRYTSANITEGLQEVYQESLSAGLVDHYTNQNWGTQRIGEAGLWNSLKIGAKELDRNNMALETFLSGFLMAAPIGGIQTIAFKKAPQLLQRIAKPEQYKQQQKSRQKSINALENALTDLVNDPTKWANDFYANATKQNQLAMEGLEAEQAGDVKAAKDAQEESMFNHMYTMLQHNMMGEFRDQMKDLLTLNDTELQEAFGGTKGTNNADTYNSDLRSRINKSIASSEKLEERYKKANDTFINPFNRQNPDEFIDYYGFEEAKKLYVFNEHMFEQTVNRAQSIFNNLSANEKVSQLVAGNISSILDTRAGGQLDQLINLLKQEIKTYEGGTKEDIKLAEEKKKQLEGLEEWKNAATAYEQAYDSMTMAGLDPEQAARYVEEAKRFPRGATVEYTNQKGEKVQGKVVSKAGSNLILEIINKAGRKQRVAIKVEKAAVVGQLTLDFDAKDLEGQDMVDSLEYLFQALFGKMEGMGTKGIEGPGGYMQTLAGAGGLNMTREEMAEVFNNIMDYFRLKKDSMTHLNAINRLADPGFFASSAERIGTAQKAAKRIAELKIKVMLADFEKIQDRHILLQELFELGVFLDPKDVDGLINDKKIPSSFYTATNVDGIPELTFIDPLNKDHQSLYKKIIDVLEAYETKEGVAFTGKVDVNIFQQALSGQLGQVYRKTANDSRTIKDLAKEYGFNVDETSEVDVKELFQKIIDSDYGRPHDKVLARRLLATIPEGFKIKFDRNHGVGVSYDSTNGVIVNPNFSAENYQGGQVALESLILNGVMQKLVADNLSNKEFKTAIEKIKAQVAEALANGQLDQIIAELKSKYDIVFTDSSGKVVVDNIAGMRSLEQFVAMAMTDPAFQSLLANVTVEETQKTLWEEFLDAVKLLVQTLTGMAPGTTALEETINLTTAALTGSNITTTTEETPVATKPTVATPLNSMPEELRTALQTAWTALSPEDKSGYTDISEWVKGSSAAASIINKYNKQKEQKEAETKTEEELKLAALTPQQLSYLRNKSGLNDKDIFAMDINDLVEIANSRFRILNEGEKLTASQVSQGVVVKEFNGIKMTNATTVNPAFTEDPITAQKLTQVGSELEQLLANALGRGNNKKVTLLDNATKSLAEQIIGQIKAIYNIKDLEFTEEMGSKIRLLLSDKSTFFFRVTSLKDIVEDIRNSSKAELPQKLSEAIQNLLTQAPATEQMKAGADRGLVFDEFFRLTLQGTLNAVIDDTYVTNFLNQALENTKKTLNVSQEIILTPAAIAELRQTLEHVVAYMKENNLRALTSTNELFGNIGVMPVSGQVDIIMYNDKGELFILDMKTMSSSLDRAQMEGYGREVTGKTKDDRFGYASKDTAQLNIYRELIQALVGAELQKAGMQIKGLGIIPLLVNASLNNSNELIIKSIKLSDPIREDSAGTRGLYIPVLEKTTIELFPELYAQAPPSAPTVSDEIADIQKKIKGLEDKINTTYRFMGNTDSNAAIVQAEKDIKMYEKELENLKKELAVLERAPVSDIDAKKAEIERIRQENDSLGKSILQKLGYKNENRLPNGNVKGGQSGWKIRFNIKSPTGENYFNKGNKILENDKHYNEQAQKLVDWLNNYFQTTSKGSVQEAIKGYNLHGFNKENPSSIWKFLSGGEQGEADFTIYIGSADDVLKFVEDVKASPIANLLVAGNQGSDVNITSDGIFKARIEGASIGFSGYGAPTNLNNVTGKDDFTFVFDGKRVNINYGKTKNISDISIIVEGGNAQGVNFSYKVVGDENLKKDFPELYKNIRNIIGFQLYGDYLQGSNDEFLKLTGVDKINAKYNAELAALTQPIAPVSDKKAEGTNARGTTYKGKTTEKDGLKVTEYSEFRPDGRKISKGGRIMTPSEFIEEYNITDQVHLDSLEGATEIRIYEVRVGKDGKSGISIQGTFPEGKAEMEVAGTELAALAGGGQQSPSSTSVINQEILNEYAGQVIYVSPGIKISKELANDPNVILYDDFIIGILNQHLDELGVEEFTQENLFANLGEIFGSKNKIARNKLTSLLNNDVYNAAINELAENPEKILITQSNIFTKDAGNNVAVAIVPESLESYDNKSLALLEQKEFRKNSRLRTTKSTDLQEILKNPLTKLDKQRDLTARGESATYEEFVKQAEFDSLILLVTELDTMEDGDFIFEQEVDGELRDQKNYLYTLIKTELQKRMKDGIITKNELLKVAKEGDIVIMANTELYARGLGVVTKKGNIKAIYYNESASDDFKQFGLPPSESNKVIGVEQLAEILEEEGTTEDENLQAAENNEQAALTSNEEINLSNNPIDSNTALDDLNIC